MSREHGIRSALILGFAVLVGSIGPLQAGLELASGEPIQVLEVLEEVPTVASLRAFEKRLEEQSIVAAELRPWLRYATFRLFRDAGTEVLAGRDGWWFYGKGLDYLVLLEPDPPRPDGGREAARSAIVGFRDQLAARGIELLVVPVPGKASVYPDGLSPLAGGALEETTTTVLIDELVADGVEVVDLLAAFREDRADREIDAREPLYLREDTHWSPRGVRVAARTIAGRLRELGVVSAGAEAFETREVVVPRVGDLVRMVKSPPLETHLGATEVACEQVVSAETGEPYRDSADAEVLVLGDSFLRIYEGDEPGSAGLLAHLARELGRPVDSIVGDGGASTLVRQQLARQIERLEGKRVVVWEFVERDVRFGLGGWRLVPLP